MNPRPEQDKTRPAPAPSVSTPRPSVSTLPLFYTFDLVKLTVTTFASRIGNFFTSTVT
jgi:hypothetical protein